MEKIKKKNSKKDFSFKVEKLSNNEIKKINFKINRYFNYLNKNGVKYALDNQSKPYINSLSLGCKTCMDFTWACLYSNVLCTRNCFYCPQDRKIKEEKNPKSEENIFFDSVEDCINYLKKFNFKGIGFSGGEPFLIFNTLVKYIKKIKEVFGSKHYIWMYTNGDLVTEEKLKILNKLGLDEIRFDLSARDYDIKPVELAIKHIKTVTIEIPAIPEDLERIKYLLKKFEDMGVKYLNLHQLSMNKFNYKEYVKRRYILFLPDLKVQSFPVIESEISALELLKYGIESKTKIGINYCSVCYKQRFQRQSLRERHFSNCKESFDYFTSSKYLRRFLIEPSKDKLDKIKNILKKYSKSEYKIINNRNMNILVSLELLFKIFKDIFSLNSKIKILYYNFLIGDLNEKNMKRFEKKYRNKKLILNKFQIAEIELENESAIIFFKKLFIENKRFEQIINEFSKEYDLDKNEKDELFQDLKHFYRQFADLEYLPKYFPMYRNKDLSRLKN